MTLASPSRAAQKYASTVLSAANSCSEKAGARIASFNRRRFIMLSTSEFVTDTSSESSIGGGTGIALAHVLVDESGTSLVDIWLIGRFPTVCRILLLMSRIKRETFNNPDSGLGMY